MERSRQTKLAVISRIGVLLMLLAWVAFIGAFYGEFHRVIYMIVVAAHALNMIGWAITASADYAGERKFVVNKLVLMALTEFILAIGGPIAMGAAKAP